MAATDWEITGLYDIYSYSGSHRFRAKGNVDAKWKGRNDLADCRIILDLFFNSYSRGGPFLRFDENLERGYYLQIKQQSAGVADHGFYRYENSVATSLFFLRDDHFTPSPYTIRFSICGSMLNLDVLYEGSWLNIANFNDPDPIGSGCAGFRTRQDSNQTMAFDNIKIEEKI